MKGAKMRLEVNNWPIRYKLIVHFLLVSIIPSIALGVTIGLTVDHIVERQVNDHTLQLIHKVNQSLEHYAGNLQNMTYLIAFNPDVQAFLVEENQWDVRNPNYDNNDNKNIEYRNSGGGNFDLEETNSNRQYRIRKFLQSFTTLYPEVAGILVVNSNGDYISNELYARTAANLTRESWYQEAVENEGIFKMIGTPSGRNLTSHVEYQDDEVISVVRAIMDPETNRAVGVILIDFKLRIIAETLKNVRLGKMGYLMIVDEQGNPIYRSLTNMNHRVPLDQFGDATTGTLIEKVDGEWLQFVYRKSNFTNWTTVGVFPGSESASEMRNIRFYLVSFVFIVCLFGITASYYLSLSISRPIGQLMSFMRKAESGDLHIRYTGSRKDEIGMLGRSFNRMLLQIQNLLKLTEQHERQKREAELRSLQAHIKPHFLYNTLDTVHWLARKKGAMEVAEVVESLSRLFRIGLSKGDDRIFLSEEIEHVRSYLNIQHVRYKEKLNWTIEVEPGLENVVVLKMILQPIVENAIYHGIKERRGPGNIHIRGEKQNGLLVLSVSDDGIGMKEETLQRLRQKLNEVEQAKNTATENRDVSPPALMRTSGYGILNVQERIRLTFGKRYGIQIESEYGKGTEVTIRLPLLQDKNMDKDI